MLKEVKCIEVWNRACLIIIIIIIIIMIMIMIMITIIIIIIVIITKIMIVMMLSGNGTNNYFKLVQDALRVIIRMKKAKTRANPVLLGISAIVIQQTSLRTSVRLVIIAL